MRRDFWKKNGLAVPGILCLLIAWQGRAMETVTGQESVVPEQQEARKVALTFDDGPSEYTMELSRGLKERGVQTNQLIREWTGEDPLYIRPPYGAWSQELENVVDMIPVFWNVDSLDWKLQNKERVLCCLSGQVEEGDMILMHDGYQSSVDAAFALVDQLQNQGFVFVNVEEMILE